MDIQLYLLLPLPLPLPPSLPPFVEALQHLEIEPYLSEAEINACGGNIEEIIKLYERHPSILKINENVNVRDKFVFDDTTSQGINKQILDLDHKKASIENDIPIKILIRSNDIVSKHLAEIYNNSKKIMSTLKLGTITPINKKATLNSIKKRLLSSKLDPINFQAIRKEHV